MDNLRLLRLCSEFLSARFWTVFTLVFQLPE